jgi:spoIIIJ-associated protein
MRSVESEGATIDLAIAHALTALGAHRDQVQIEILESGNRGIFGIGRRRARVRASMRPALRTLLDLSGDAGRRASAQPPPSEGTAAVLGELLRLMGIDATVEQHDLGRPGELHLEIGGPGSRAMVGRDGEVLDAIEYILNRAAERGGRALEQVFVDAAGYRSERRAALEDLARRLAERVRLRGKAVSTSPLSPAERRIVQGVLRSEQNVTARIVGQGAHRKVVIIPEGRRRGGSDKAPA